MFRAGELDFVAGMPGNKIDFLREHLNAETRIGPRPANNYIVFNTKAEPFTDVRVRHALSLGIDREIYTDKVLRRGEEPAYSYVPSATENYSPHPLYFKSMTMDERKARATQLLEEAGFNKSNPLTFELRVRGSPDRRRGALAVRGMWKAIGVNAEILSTDLKVHYADLYLNKFQAADAGFVSGSGPELFLEEFISTNPQGNFSQYDNPVYDALMREALQIANVEKRYAMMAEAEAVMMKDYPVAPINFSVTGNLVQTFVRGYADNLYDAHPSQYMWIEKTGE